MKVVASLLVLVAVMVMADSVPTGQEFIDLPPEVEEKVINQIAARILRTARLSPFGYVPTTLAKRNSELINSLLGLPKVMNDAGK